MLKKMSAIQELSKLLRFIREKQASGSLSSDEVRAVEELGAQTMGRSGVVRTGDKAAEGVARHGVHVMKKWILELHPEFERDLQSLGEGRQR